MKIKISGREPASATRTRHSKSDKSDVGEEAGETRTSFYQDRRASMAKYGDDGLLAGIKIR